MSMYFSVHNTTCILHVINVHIMLINIFLMYMLHKQWLKLDMQLKYVTRA